MAELIEFKRPDGLAVKGWLASAKQPLGAVVVIQEWWGLNDQIRGVAQRFADAGFTALVPDLYRGKSTVEAEEAHHLMTGLNFGDAASQDVRGAVQYLKARKAGSGKVGVTGYCMGGALTVLASTMVPEADAAVVWYGYPPLEYVDASKIKLPMQAHWATQDGAFAIDGVDQLEAKFEEAKVATRPPVSGAPRLCQRDRSGPAPHRDDAVRPGLGSDGLGPHDALLRSHRRLNGCRALLRSR